MKLPRWEDGAALPAEKAIEKANNSFRIFIPNILDRR